MMIYLIYFVFSSIFVFVFAAPGDTIIVEIANGFVRGVESMTENNKQTFAFLGIPYAEPPVGHLRFRSPVAKVNWKGIWDATKPRNMCIQSPSKNKIQGDEDCLFLYVYTTQLSNNSINPLLPILVYIHGGSFNQGSGNLELHGADRFLEKDIIVVSINFRLGVLGHLCTSDKIAPGNYALKDQIMALHWIQNNIVSFGGDRNRVTIFGKSAGAVSVDYLRLAKLAAGLFHRVIANSGTTLSPISISKNSTYIAFHIGRINGIQTENSTTLTEELRKIDPQDLQKSVWTPSLQESFDRLQQFPFAPCIEDPFDDAVFVTDSFEAIKNCDFNYGPLLLGYNSFEGKDLSKIIFNGFTGLDQYNLFPSKLTPINIDASTEDKDIIGLNIKSFYFHNKSVSTQPEINYFEGDNIFVRGIITLSQLESQCTDVYMYRFSFTGGVKHTHSNPEGAEHDEEMQFLFLSNDTIQTSLSAQRTVERMIQMYTNFVKTGNPTPVHSAEVNITWPVVNAAGNYNIYYLDIGDELEVKINPEQKQMVFWNEQYSKHRNHISSSSSSFSVYNFRQCYEFLLYCSFQFFFIFYYY